MTDPDRSTAELIPLLRPLASLLGVGLTHLGEVLCPYHRQAPAAAGSWISCGGRTARTAWPIWPLCALVVLAAEMAAAGEDLAFARDVLRRQPAQHRRRGDQCATGSRAHTMAVKSGELVTACDMHT